MHVKLAVVFIAIMAAGCAAPTGTPRAGDAGAPMLARDADIDLHNVTMNITMPSGEPTALIILNVTKDMWVRPFAAPGATGLTGPLPASAPLTDQRYWTICPWGALYGLPENEQTQLLFFWKENGSLVPATPWLDNFWDSSNGAGCLLSPITANEYLGISAPEPRDGKLFVIVAARPDRVDKDIVAVPEYNLVIGIGKTGCPDSARICAPKTETQSAPAARGGAVLHSFLETEITGDDCKTCGFALDDQRTRVGIATTGTFGANNSANGPVFSYSTAYVNACTPCPVRTQPPGGGGQASVSITVDADGIVSRGACADPYFGMVQIAASSERAVSTRAIIGTTGSYYLRIETAYIPIDPALFGTVAPMVSTFNTNPPVASAEMIGGCN